ncbi:hypothetical protein M5K25_012322 [Dendrobium thyrsiflorum]|uniref:Uncharacterized protein n=1 Tax=Dendrobium thyrsiflorum TaxID=117978 RepID=A0ABD0V3S0_DENTH
MAGRFETGKETRLLSSSSSLLSSSARIDGLRRDGGLAGGRFLKKSTSRNLCKFLLFGTFEESKDALLRFNMIRADGALGSVGFLDGDARF